MPFNASRNEDRYFTPAFEFSVGPVSQPAAGSLPRAIQISLVIIAGPLVKCYL